SEKEGTDIKYIGMRSTLGGTAHLVNPWGSASVQVRNGADDSVIASFTGTTFDVDTTPGAVYVIERTAKTFASYTPAPIDAGRNAATKHLDGTMCTLGM